MIIRKRNVSNYKQKREIGKLASTFIEQNDIIYIDTGTTTIHILDNVDENLTFTLITNSLDIINKATRFKNVTIFIIGEKYVAARSFTGIKSQSIIEKFNIKKAFMSATGINIKNGLSNAELEENLIKQTVIRQSETKYALTIILKLVKLRYLLTHNSTN